MSLFRRSALASQAKTPHPPGSPCSWRCASSGPAALRRLSESAQGVWIVLAVATRTSSHPINAQRRTTRRAIGCRWDHALPLTSLRTRPQKRTMGMRAIPKTQRRCGRALSLLRASPSLSPPPLFHRPPSRHPGTPPTQHPHQSCHSFANTSPPQGRLDSQGAVSAAGHRDRACGVQLA